MTKKHLERLLYFALALVSGTAPLALSPIVAGLLLALINLAFALYT